jgi:hypothetical protein
LQFCFSLLISKSMFKGVSQCISTVSSTPSVALPYPLPPTPHFQHLSIHNVISLPSQMLCFMILTLSFSFSFPSFPECHNVVPLLQTCSLYRFVYDHVCFCVYVCLLDVSSTYERKHVVFIFLNVTYFTSHDVLQLYPFTFQPCDVFLPYG